MVADQFKIATGYESVTVAKPLKVTSPGSKSANSDVYRAGYARVIGPDSHSAGEFGKPLRRKSGCPARRRPGTLHVGADQGTVAQELFLTGQLSLADI